MLIPKKLKGHLKASALKLVSRWVSPEYARYAYSQEGEDLPAETMIDFLSVDVEGLDHEVIASNDWERYRPLLLLIEDGDSRSIEEAQHGAITTFMQSKGYEFLSKTALILFFKDTRHWDKRHRA